MNIHQDLPKPQLPSRRKDATQPPPNTSQLWSSRPDLTGVQADRYVGRGWGRPSRGGRNSSGSRLRLDPRMVRKDVLFFDFGTFVAFLFSRTASKTRFNIGSHEMEKIRAGNFQAENSYAPNVDLHTVSTAQRYPAAYSSMVPTAITICLSATPCPSTCL